MIDLLLGFSFVGFVYLVGCQFLAERFSLSSRRFTVIISLVIVGALSLWLAYFSQAQAPIICGVEEKSPAYLAGLRAGQRVLQVNEAQINTVRDFWRAYFSAEKDLNIGIQSSDGKELQWKRTKGASLASGRILSAQLSAELLDGVELECVMPVVTSTLNERMNLQNTSSFWSSRFFSIFDKKIETRQTLRDFFQKNAKVHFFSLRYSADTYLKTAIYQREWGKDPLVDLGQQYPMAGGWSLDFAPLFLSANWFSIFEVNVRTVVRLLGFSVGNSWKMLWTEWDRLPKQWYAVDHNVIDSGFILFRMHTLLVGTLLSFLIVLALEKGFAKKEFRFSNRVFIVVVLFFALLLFGRDLFYWSA